MTSVEASAAVDAAAALLDLPLDPLHRPGVLRYFALAADMAALVEAVPLLPQHEAAVHFTPISPRDTAPRP